MFWEICLRDLLTIVVNELLTSVVNGFSRIYFSLNVDNCLRDFHVCFQAMFLIWFLEDFLEIWLEDLFEKVTSAVHSRSISQNCCQRFSERPLATIINETLLQMFLKNLFFIECQRFLREFLMWFLKGVFRGFSRGFSNDFIGGFLRDCLQLLFYGFYVCF